MRFSEAQRAFRGQPENVDFVDDPNDPRRLVRRLNPWHSFSMRERARLARLHFPRLATPDVQLPDAIFVNPPLWQRKNPAGFVSVQRIIGEVLPDQPDTLQDLKRQRGVVNALSSYLAWVRASGQPYVMSDLAAPEQYMYGRPAHTFYDKEVYLIDIEPKPVPIGPHEPNGHDYFPGHLTAMSQAVNDWAERLDMAPPLG